MKGRRQFAEELEGAIKTFKQYVDREQNLMKKSKLLSFVPYVERAFDMPEIQWYIKKAISDADAKHAFHEYQDMLAVAKAERISKWKRILPYWWAMFVIISVAVIYKGFETRYIYYTPTGTEVSSDVYNGTKMVIKEEAITINFDHTTQSFVNHPALRIGGIMIVAIGLVLLTVVKLEYI